MAWDPLSLNGQEIASAGSCRAAIVVRTRIALIAEKASSFAKDLGRIPLRIQMSHSPNLRFCARDEHRRIVCALNVALQG